MIETDQNQICSPFYNLFKPYLLGVVFPSIVLTSFLGFGFYPTLFTIPILVFSTIFLVTFTNKRKLVLEENPTASNKLIKGEVEVIETVNPRSDAAQEAYDVGIVKEFQAESSQNLASDSESSDDSGNNVQQNPDETSDDDDDEEEEGLIEIAIPSTDQCSGLSHEIEPKVTNDLQSNMLPNFLPESIFNQQEFVELLAELNEVNEEENLIEIDISMGSIKCPRFEIEA